MTDMVERVALAIAEKYGPPKDAYAEAMLREAARAAIDAVRDVLEWLLEDPPATLNEPDADAEVIIKMRAIVRAALSTSKCGGE